MKFLEIFLKALPLGIKWEEEVEVGDGEKHCPHCNQVKPLEDFYWSKRHNDRFYPDTPCIDCKESGV